MRDYIQIAWDDESLQLLRPAYTNEGAYRFAVSRMLFKGAVVIICWDTYKDSERVTVALINGAADQGNLLWDSLQIVARQRDELVTLHDGGPGGIRVSGTFARRKTWGEDFYEPTAAPAPCIPEDWHSQLATKGYIGFIDPAKYNTVRDVGDYRIGTPMVKGVTSFNGSHGGYRVGPYHFGPEGWQRAYSDGYRWAEAEFFAELARTPLAYYHGVDPYQPMGEYWCGRSNVFLQGHEPDLTSLKELQAWQPHNADHMHRATAAPAMLAPRDVFARIVLVEHYWNDFRCWLDGEESENPLFQPLRQVLEGPHHQGWSRGGRGFAHAVGCFTFAEPYLSGESRGGQDDYHTSEGETWSGFLKEAIRLLATPAGLVHRMDLDPQYGNPDSCRSREADLLFTPMRRLGLDLICERQKHTMQRNAYTSVPSAVNAFASPWWEANLRPYPKLVDDLPPYRDGYYPLYDLIREDPTFLQEALEWKGAVGDPYDPVIQLVPPALYAEGTS